METEQWEEKTLVMSETILMIMIFNIQSTDFLM